MAANPILPLELQREIFELTAVLHPRCMPALLRVARRVKIWIEPLLYRVLCIRVSSSQFSPCQLSANQFRTLMTTKSADFFQEHVRHIRFAGYCIPQDIIEILAVCTNVVDICMWDPPYTPSLLPHLRALALRRLSTVLNPLFPAPGPGIDSADPLFSRMTHLQVYDEPHISWDRWNGLALLPQLTHLVFEDMLVPTSFCQHLLATCKSLQVLVLLCSTNAHLESCAQDRAELADDPRLVLLAISNIHTDWEAGARRGEDIWTRAEALIKQRRAGETDSESVCWLGPFLTMCTRLVGCCRFVNIVAHSLASDYTPNELIRVLYSTWYVHAELRAGHGKMPVKIIVKT
ncbi:hypothetical protein DFH09DRAFT_1019985 [Mycena vulgaris]|nr:hypothetical protein DFH09DRAFT_1019985 [Mycena vulgaris]